MENAFIGDVMSRALKRNEISEKQELAVLAAVARIEVEAAAKAGSNYVGEVGKRIELKVVVERKAFFVRPSFRGYGTDTVFIISMRDENGNAIVNKSSAFSAGKGDEFVLRATVKEHSEYKREKQTLVQRVKIIEEAKEPA
jgi:hypothetical protein